MQREKRKREEEVNKILESYLPIRLEIKKLKAAQEECERELFRKEGELADARKKNHSLLNLDLMKGEIESKRKQLRQQGRDSTQSRKLSTKVFPKTLQKVKLKNPKNRS